ncbi:MAG: response regulator [Candidatus Aminicenantes bacterium]|nr:response regulator [Candidatus Aminicenantes bacterium]
MTEQTKTNILVVDDEPSICHLVSRLLEKQGYACATCESATEAIKKIESGAYELVISDIMMPGMTGIDLLARIKKSRPDIAFIMLTAIDDHETAVRALDLGAFGYVIKPFEANELIITSGYRDEETGAHIRRMGEYAAILAQGIGLKAEAVEEIRLAAPMHDIGKIGVADAILRKPGKLTDEEFKQIKEHTTIGARILEGSPIALLNLARDIALYHHEKWNGSGYQQGLRDEAIPLCARIVAVCDVYDALVNDRVYRPALPEDKALAIMKEGRSTHFDPRILDIFLDQLPQIHAIRDQIRE